MSGRVPDIHDERAFRAEIIIADILAYGVWLSLALILAGTVMIFVRDGDYGRSSEDVARLIAADTRFEPSREWLLDGLRHARGAAILVLGLLALIATPVVRVLVSALVFIIGRDRRYAAITLAVFALLVVSFVLGNVE